MMKNIENNNATVKTWKNDFAEIISRQTGFPLNAEMIFSDERDWEFYIGKNSLQEKSPLLLMNYMGELMAVIPEKDYRSLDTKEVWPFEYVPKVKWYYGQYLDNAHSTMDVFWQPIENRVGINDKSKISRYLQMLKCRIDFYRTNEMPSDETCENCEIQNCPFSTLDSKKANSDWNKEVQERDFRMELFDAVKERVKDELGLEVTKYTHHTGSKALLLMTSEISKTTRDQVELYLPIKMLNFLMYNPVYRNWKQYAKSYTFELGVEGKEERIIVSNETKDLAEYCREKFEILCSEQPESVEEVTTEEVTAEDVPAENTEDVSCELVDGNAPANVEPPKNGEKAGLLQKMRKFFFG